MKIHSYTYFLQYEISEMQAISSSPNLILCIYCYWYCLISLSHISSIYIYISYTNIFVFWVIISYSFLFFCHSSHDCSLVFLHLSTLILLPHLSSFLHFSIFYLCTRGICWRVDNELLCPLNFVLYLILLPESKIAEQIIFFFFLQKLVK